VAKTAIKPTRDENYPIWYQNVIKEADLAENSKVRGCMVIKPRGYAIWESMKAVLDKMFKKTGHKNAYFPLFIPKEYLEKEAEHVEGFAKECAVVTHTRLEKGKNGGLEPMGKLQQELIVRPTSETIIGESFSNWVKSYRDLPLLINQWANVVRWEKRPRLFIRTSEFLWQEGHTVHATQQEAILETKTMLDIYATFCQDYLAIPVIKGIKTEAEKFPGAVSTYCIEAMMQDKKSLQTGTSHFLGQNFAKSSKIMFQDELGKNQYGWTTSWGVSTRLIGALIMSHSDDNGLVIPPKIASEHIVIVPVFKNKQELEKIKPFVENLKKELSEISYFDKNLEIVCDYENSTAGNRIWSWIKKGVPIRLEIGLRDIAKDSLFMGRRDRMANQKKAIKREDFISNVSTILDDIQANIFLKAKNFMDKNIKSIEEKDDFYNLFNSSDGCFIMAHWCEKAECEKKIKEELQVTIRCTPLKEKEENGICIYCGGKSKKRVLFAKSY